MPFTLFHPALILPFCRLPRRWVSVTGLCAGSVAPDFEKFAKMHSDNVYSHTWPSLLYFTLPVGVGLAIVFHALVRNPLLRHLPAPLRGRLVRFREFRWPRHFRKHYPAVLVSVLLGGATHLLWDAFTHWHSPYAAWLPWLDAHLLVGSLRIPGFALMNAGTSLLGAFALYRALWGLPEAAKPVAPAANIRAYWGTVAALTGLIAGLRMVALNNWDSGWDVIITLFSAFLFSLALTPMVRKWARL